jgi:ornithine carbamoyltransferase
MRTPHPRSYLRVADLNPSEVAGVLDLADSMSADPPSSTWSLSGQTLVCYFDRPSTRARVSFAAAAHRLGMLPLMLHPDELQLHRGESLSDTARSIASYCAAIIIRTFDQNLMGEFAEASSVPVINALTDEHHPCQALVDLLTLRQRFGVLAGLRLAFVGNGNNNVTHSLLEAGALTGMHVVVASPPGYEPDARILVAAERLAAKHGGRVEVVTDPAEAVAGADAVYTDVWVSMGREAEEDRRLQDLAPYQVTELLMDRANSRAVFLHCLPARRGQEVATDVIDGRRSAVWQQVANHLPTEQAIIYSLVTESLS